jgi:hypothetical protein
MVDILRRDKIDSQAIKDRLGPYWEGPYDLIINNELGEDSWVYYGPGKSMIIVSYDPDTEPGVGWVHASISYTHRQRMPSYADIKRMHAAVFRDGHAYQCFVPTDQHINETANVLHLWGRLNGEPVLPNFGWAGTI